MTTASKDAGLKLFRDGLTAGEPGAQWRGLDCRFGEGHPSGVLRVSQNLTLRPDKRLGVRPGFQGQFAAVVAGAVVASVEFTHSSGSALLLSVAASGGGEIWRHDVGTTTKTKISGSVLFDALKVNFARLGTWMVISGAQNGNLYRYDGTTFEVAMGLATPAYSITPTLTSRGALMDFSDVSRWRSQWVGSPGNKISDAEGLFPAGSTIRTDSPGAATGNKMEAFDPPVGGIDCIELQPNSAGATESTEFDSIELSARVEDFLDDTSPAAGTGRAGFARLGYFAAAEDAASIYPAGLSRIRAYSDTPGTALLAAATRDFVHPALSRDTPLHVAWLWDGRGQGAASVVPYWEYTGLDTSRGLDVTRASLTIFGEKFAVANVGTRAEVRQGTHPADGGRVLLAGAWLEYKLSVAASWPASRAFLDLETPITTALVKISVASAGASYDVATLAIDPDTKRYELDLSAVTPAILAAVLTLRITFLSDVAITGVTDQSNALLLRLGSLLCPGPLSVGSAAYRWRVVEAAASGLTSPAGAQSAGVEPTEDNATGSIVLGAGIPQNAGSTIKFYRVGGLITSWRLVAAVSAVASSSAAGFAWNHTTRTFTDYTSDELLTLADSLIDHIGPPVNARAIGTYARRLAVLTDDALYVSRSGSGVESGLYFDSANDPSAANFAQQGVIFSSADAAGLVTSPGEALRCVPWDNRLICFFSSAVLSFSGSSPADFALIAMETGTGGLLSRRAVCVHAQRLVWLSGVGLLALAAGGDQERRGSLEALGAPVAAITGIGGEWDRDAGMTAALALCGLWSADGRLFWSLPNSIVQAAGVAPLVGTPAAGSGAFVVLVMIGFGKGSPWFMWQGFPSQVNGGQTVSARRGFWALGEAGQVYRVADGFGDKALSGSSAVAVAVAAASAWRGAADVSHRLVSAGFSAVASADTTISIQAYTLQAYSSVLQHSVAGWGLVAGVGAAPRRVRFDRAIQGDRFSWYLTANPTGDFALSDVELHVSEGGLARRA